MLEGPLDGARLCKDPVSGKLRVILYGTCEDGEGAADLKEYDKVVLCLGWKFD